MALYTVQPGDTLPKIARRFDSTAAELADYNDISAFDIPVVGSELIVPDALGLFPTGLDDESLLRQGASSASVVSGFRYTLTTDRRQYSRGQRVQISFTKCNTANRTVVLRYNTSQRFDLVVRRGGQEIWRWSDGRFFNRISGTETFRPGQCRTYSASWDLRDRRGNLVAPGNYTLQAFNVAEGLRNRFVQTSIQVTGAAPTPPTPFPPTPPRPPQPGSCPQTNILRDPGLEQWRSLTTPLIWSGSNIRRTMFSQSGSFAAEMGARPNLQATLTQRAAASSGRIYRIDFSAREQTRPRGTSRYTLELEIFLFNQSGTFIGRIDPTYSQNSIPDNRFGRFSFTTGILRQGTAQMEIRFILRPGNSNDSSVIIDNVSAVCVR